VERRLLHLLSRPAILATLKAQTTVRMAWDESRTGGWRLETGRFSGREEVPAW
jgi:hypothetical protein